MTHLFRYFNRLPFALALKLLLVQLTRKLLMPSVKLEFSYAGENSILNDLFQYKESGFYIDVGCNHPIKSSNTFLLYLRGWTGIAIDANAKLIEEFKRVRKEDIAVHAAISNIEEEVNYYEFYGADLLNTIQDEVGTGVQQQYGLKQVVKMKTQPLTAILKDHGIQPNTRIDLLSIDVEGLDYQVLTSLDLNLYRPQFILIECHGFDLDHPSDNNIYMHLLSHDYKFIGYISMNAYFKSNKK